MKHSLFLTRILMAALLMAAGCAPFQTEEISLPAAPQATFTWTFAPGDSNRVIVNDASAGSFVRLWDFGNGKFSDAATDTAYYPFAGVFKISLSVSGQGGMSQQEETITIVRDAEVVCDSTLFYLAGGCGTTDSAAWVFAQVAGTIKVGPTPLSAEWFSSSAGSLQAEQYDDSWVFAFNGSRFQYYNNGLTVDPGQGYIPVPLTPATNVTWTLSPGTGFNGADQIILPSGSFIGVMDSGPIYDIVEVSPSILVLLSPLAAGGGYFTLTFIRR
ncbi:MAG: hypothetical protein SF053_04380 [Bacteroidia bacterium]|nr:hypothetical protein [Bacteroidia bacterium]